MTGQTGARRAATSGAGALSPSAREELLARGFREHLLVPLAPDPQGRHQAEFPSHQSQQSQRRPASREARR